MYWESRGGRILNLLAADEANRHQNEYKKLPASFFKKLTLYKEREF